MNPQLWIVRGLVLFTILTVYCLGHALWLGKAWYPTLTTTWAMVHTLGVGALFIGISFYRSIPYAPIIGFLVGFCLGPMTWSWLTESGLPAYNTTAFYLALTAVLFLRAKHPDTTTPNTSEASSAKPVACRSDEQHAVNHLPINSEPIATILLTVDFGRYRGTVNSNEITHLSAARNYVEIHTRQGSGIVRSTLNQLAGDLPQTFIRVHRSHIVNAAAVVQLRQHKPRGWYLQLTDGSRLPVSQSYQSAVARQFVPDLANSSQS